MKFVQLLSHPDIYGKPLLHALADDGSAWWFEPMDTLNSGRRTLAEYAAVAAEYQRRYGDPNKLTEA
jgi:hypothetical protein